ncbi:MAG: hypothetical protein M5U26_08320 [Planctomycetota bacterium]|nr:hypothetical protein [Planctomycetota bacterium]
MENQSSEFRVPSSEPAPAQIQWLKPDPRSAREKLAGLLKEQQLALSLSQSGLAARCGLAKFKINRWLRGLGRAPSAKDLERLGARLGCAPEAAAIAAAFRAERRKPRWRGFEHGDGI